MGFTANILRRTLEVGGIRKSKKESQGHSGSSRRWVYMSKIFILNVEKWIALTVTSRKKQKTGKGECYHSNR